MSVSLREYFPVTNIYILIYAPKSESKKINLLLDSRLARATNW